MSLTDSDIETIDARIEILKQYLRSCIDVEDWHGVRDAAVDIEVATSVRDAIEAQYEYEESEDEEE